MATPDEVFEQVLAEETAKGSSPAVAQARAKAARVRAQRGSKNPSVPDKSTAPPPAGNPDGGGSADAPAAEAEAKPDCSRVQARGGSYPGQAGGSGKACIETRFGRSGKESCG